MMAVTIVRELRRVLAGLLVCLPALLHHVVRDVLRIAERGGTSWTAVSASPAARRSAPGGVVGAGAVPG